MLKGTIRVVVIYIHHGRPNGCECETRADVVGATTTTTTERVRRDRAFCAMRTLPETYRIRC
jgi:hypothetical protein